MRCTLLRATNTVATFMPSTLAASTPERPSTASRRNASQVRGSTRMRTRADASSSSSRSAASARRLARSSLASTADRRSRAASPPLPWPGLRCLARWSRQAWWVTVLSQARKLRRVVLKVVHPRRELEEHLLGHVLGVGLLHPPGLAPRVDVAAVPADELRPGGRVTGGGPEPPQQGDACF